MDHPEKQTEFMKAAQASKFGDAADVLTVSPSVARPGPPGKREVQIMVHACSLSPGDYRMLSGAGDLVKKPSSWPYVPGGDVAGVVVSVGARCRRGFAVGDRVIGTWETCGVGGLAEYTNVLEIYVEKIPVICPAGGDDKDKGKEREVSFVDAAALADSSVNALLALEDAKVTSTDRVLILGGSGGIGTALLELLRQHIRNDAPVVVTSTQHDLCTRLGATHVVDYTAANWWESEHVRAHAPFDVVLDCAEGAKTWNRIVDGEPNDLVKPAADGGRFIAVVVNDWHIEVHKPWDLVAFMWPMIKRSFYSCVHSKAVPSYKMLFPAPRGNSLERLLAVVSKGECDVVIDPNGPHPLTTDGVRHAFNIMTSRKAHGKVVIQIRDD